MERMGIDRLRFSALGGQIGVVKPANIEGTWTIAVGNNPGPVVKIQQKFQKIEGTSEWGSLAGPLHEASVRGPEIRFTLTDANGVLHRFEGYSDHRGPMVGIVTPYSGGAPRLFVATRR